MNNRLQMRIVEIECMRRNAVQQSRARNIDTFATAEDGRLRRWRELHHCRECRVCGGMVRCADGASEPIHECAMRFGIDVMAPSARRMIGDKFGEDARDGGRVVVGVDLCVLGHIPGSV